MTATADLAAPSVTRTPTSPSTAQDITRGDTGAPRPQQGFVLWVGVYPDGRDQRTAEIVELAEALGELARELLPTAETFTALSLGETSGGRGGGRTGELGALRDRLAHLQLVERTPAAQDRAPASVAGSDAVQPAVTAPRLSIDLPSRRVSVHGVEQRLTYKEFELLAYLVTSAGRVVPRSELFASVWQSRATEPGSRTIDVHVRRLRDKLGLQVEILTVRGAGYRFEPSADVSVVQARQAG
jgi:DNA-binding winged helix-turn-helix (wHTH) protein/HAMP domain-containing protein